MLVLICLESTQNPNLHSHTQICTHLHTEPVGQNSNVIGTSCWAQPMNAKITLGNITPSICEAAFEKYTTIDDSLSEQIQKNSIGVRDFIILSFVCDQDELSIEQISGIVSLSFTKTGDCIGRLANAGLVQYKDGESESDSNRSIYATPAGRVMALRVHGLQD